MLTQAIDRRNRTARELRLGRNAKRGDNIEPQQSRSGQQTFGLTNLSNDKCFLLRQRADHFFGL
jgi:hypothetical protein